MRPQDKVNILLVDDQPAKLLSYEVILSELGENLIKAGSAREALAHLLKTDVAVVLVDVCMPELDGFQLAAMIREHPRFQQTAIIFISAIQVTELDYLRGYASGAVDYVPVPVVPEVLRAKVKVFVELYRKTRELEALNRELEQRVAERTAELEASTAWLRESEQRRSLALAAGRMGSWDWDLTTGAFRWDEGQCRIFGVDPANVPAARDGIEALIHPDDRARLWQALEGAARDAASCDIEFRIVRPDGALRWCLVSAAASAAAEGRTVRMSGVTLDITERKEAEERLVLLAREVDHRARNALAVVQSILRLSRAPTIEDFVAAVNGRVRALARAHTLLSQSRWQGADLASLVEEELAPYRTGETGRVLTSGPVVFLRPATAQTIALVLHELATNAAKYGALSARPGRVGLSWSLGEENLVLHWVETGVPCARPPSSQGFGTRMIRAAVERELGGEVRFDWTPDGLRCSLSVPRSHVADDARAMPGAAREPLPEMPPAAGAGGRILLVEDEPLIAMMMADMLTGIGFAVLGPFPDVPTALAALDGSEVDGAVLDVNLNGTQVYPVAEALRARGVPFVLVTGYDGAGIDAGYADAPILQKPIEPRALQFLLARLMAGRKERSAGTAGAARQVAAQS